MNNYYDTGNFYDLENKLFTTIIQPRGTGKALYRIRKITHEDINDMQEFSDFINKIIEEMRKKMEFTQQVKLTKEESKILRNVYKELQMINCLGVRCPHCPLYIKDSCPSCLNNIIAVILNKYGYKESDNE